MPKILLINYGVGNLRSGKKGLEKAGADVEIIDSKKTLQEGDAIVLPGVGAFAEAIKNISSMADHIKDSVNSGKPILGICLGLQILFDKSCEGGILKGLGLLSGDVVKINAEVKLPHIGWNTIKFMKFNPLLENIEDNSYVYFVHSYYAKPKDSDIEVSLTEYGEKFPSVLVHKNIFATQFHPEKSGIVGLNILKNFVNIIKR